MSPEPTAPKRQPWIRSMLPPILLLALVVYGLDVWEKKWQHYPSPYNAAIFRQTAAGWERVPNAPEDPTILAISTSGVVWTRGDAIACLKGGSWRTWSPAELGAKTVSYGSFAIDGDEVWVTTSDTVLHWDGRRWKSYPDAVRDGLPTSLVAAGGRAWAINASGKLSLFENGEWRVQSAKLPEPGDDDSPNLAITSDGTLWLVQNGVWRWDHARWSPVQALGADLKYFSVLGATRDDLWLWSGDKLRRLSTDETVETFTRADLGLSKREWPHHVVSAGASTWFATTAGILQFDGKSWRRITPPNGLKRIRTLQIAPDGTIWALGYIPNPHYRELQFLTFALPLVLAIAVIATPIWAYRRHKRQRLSHYQHLRAAVEHGTGQTPEELHLREQEVARQTTWRGTVAVLSVIFGALIAYGIVHRFWPAAPTWTYLAFALALHLIIGFWQSAVRPTPKPNDPIEPDSAFRYDWSRTWKVFPGSLVVFMLLNRETARFLDDHLHWFLYAYGAVLWHKALAIQFMLNRIRRGDYEGGLKVIRLAWYLRPNSPTALRLRAVALLFAGRYRESEESVRRAIAKFRGRSEQAQALETLGDALLEQGRYDEAQRSYEAAIRAVPGYRRPYRGMAEILLRQRRHPERALELIENVAGPSRSIRASLINGKLQDDYWSLKAWALAQLGRGPEAEQAAAAAIRVINLKSGIDIANVHRRVGLAMDALGNRKRALEYFQRASEADPRGRYGTLARAESVTTSHVS